MLLLPGDIPEQVWRPAALDKRFKGRAFFSDRPTRPMTRVEAGRIRPGKDNYLLRRFKDSVSRLDINPVIDRLAALQSVEQGCQVGHAQSLDIG